MIISMYFKKKGSLTYFQRVKTRRDAGLIVKKLQPVLPSMPSESLSVRLLEINSASNDIDRDTGVFYFR